MQSLAEFKRRARPGARFLRRFPGADIKPRFVTVAHAQTNAVVFPTGEATPDAISRSPKIRPAAAPGSIFRKRRAAASRAVR